MSKVIATFLSLAMSLSTIGQGTEAIFGRDFRVTIVPRLSGYTGVEAPAVNKFGVSACTNIKSDDKSAVRTDFLSASAIEYVPVSGDEQSGAVSINDQLGNPRLAGWSYDLETNKERPCLWDSANSPFAPASGTFVSNGDVKARI